MKLKLKKIIKKLLKINYCYSCGKCVWWSKNKMRISESPKDKYGFSVPACSRCCYEAENQ